MDTLDNQCARTAVDDGERQRVGEIAEVEFVAAGADAGLQHDFSARGQALCHRHGFQRIDETPAVDIVSARGAQVVGQQPAGEKFVHVIRGQRGVNRFHQGHGSGHVRRCHGSAGENGVGLADWSNAVIRTGAQDAGPPVAARRGHVHGAAEI